MTESHDDLYADFVRGVSFRFYQPWMKPLGYAWLSGLLAKMGRSLEILNTRLPNGHAEMYKRLVSLCELPRMSTFAIAAMINRAVSQLPADECFVNVGVWNGFTFLSGMAGNPDKRCIGVDNFSEFGGPRDAFLERFRSRCSDCHAFHDMDYREYFQTHHQGKIGFYIYDGEHSYENQLEGMRLAEPFFSDECLILVDDTNLYAPRRAISTFLAETENVYEVVSHRMTQANQHPTLWNGVTILRRRGPSSKETEIQ